ncbi:hypothetical protein PVT71_14540 [Salipiger sp. H15]|uniref:Tail tube GTA-gp10-like protein n=1 Tax=Alloyangia sp. H15 TaxID=3029062 RepID=A0AAU8ALX3_9RHOB
MTNSKRGAIAFTALGATHHLHLSINALVRYQDLFGETLIQGVQELNTAAGDVRRVVRIFYVGVDRDGSMTMEEAGDMIDDIGLKKASELVGKAVQAAFPMDEATDAAETVGKPAGNAKKARQPGEPAETN